MRAMDTDGLKCLGLPGWGPWRLGDDLLLRTSRRERPLATLAQAQEVFDVYRAARLAGAPTPDALEIVKVADGYGVIVEYVTGLGLGTHFVFGSFSIDEIGCAVGELTRTLHTATIDSGIDWAAKFACLAYEIAPLFPNQLGARLVSLVNKMPASDTLLHGDLHMGNIVVCDGKLCIIDMETVGFGHPAFDLAIMHSVLMNASNYLPQQIHLPPDRCKQMAKHLWNTILRSYFEDADPLYIAQIDKRLMILSEVYTLGYSLDIKAKKSESLSESQKERLATSIRLMQELLPQLDRLDF